MARIRERLGLYGLFGALAAFTFAHSMAETSPRASSPPYSCSSPPLTLAYPLLKPSLSVFPSVCLLAHDALGCASKRLFSPQKIVADGWSGVLFWFTAAIISLVATQLFRSLRAASAFRRWFMFFAAGVCLLELLEQASHTKLYYWFIASKHVAVFGPFAYWNNFAQFVELALPITLWAGLSKRRSSPSRICLSRPCKSAPSSPPDLAPAPR